MIPQYSWRCDGMRVRAPTDTASEKARDQEEGKTPACRPANGLALANGCQQPQTLLMPSRSAAPDADSQGLQSHQWSHARPTPFTASRCPRHPAAHVAPPEASPHRAAEPAPPTTLPKVINKGAAPRPPRPRHQHEADPGAQKQKYAQNCNFFAKQIVVTEQFLRKTRVPSMPIRPSSSTEPQRIDHTSTHALTLGKDPALARPKNATSGEKRWAK